MSVKGLMTKPPELINGSTTIMDACKAMKRRKTGAIVVAEGAKLEGIFTYRDLVDRVILEKRDPESTTIEEVMTKDVETLREDASYG